MDERGRRGARAAANAVPEARRGGVPGAGAHGGRICKRDAQRGFRGGRSHGGPRRVRPGGFADAGRARGLDPIGQCGGRARAFEDSVFRHGRDPVRRRRCVGAVPLSAVGRLSHRLRHRRRGARAGAQASGRERFREGGQYRVGGRAEAELRRPGESQVRCAAERRVETERPLAPSTLGRGPGHHDEFRSGDRSHLRGPGTRLQRR